MTDNELMPNTFDTMKNRNHFIAELLNCKSYLDVHNLICEYPKYHKHVLNKYHLVFDVHNNFYDKLTYKNGFPVIQCDVFMGSLETWVDDLACDLGVSIDTFRELENHFDKVCGIED